MLIEWIPVENKMPEDKGNKFSNRVAVVCKDRNGDAREECGVYSFNMECWLVNAKEVEVSHWMPLPALPNS